MINKLRKKIFWIIQISLSVVVLGIIILFTTLSYRNTLSSSTIFMDKLEGRIENKDEKSKESSEEKTEKNIDGVYKIQVNNNSVTSKAGELPEEVKNYAIEISNNYSSEGYIENYIYKIRRVGANGKEITLIESEATVKQLKTMIVASAIIATSGLIIICIIAQKISKTIVKPVEDAFEKQKQFVSDASHELKTPLAVIEANADVLSDKVGENKWVTYIKEEVESMDKLVNDLLTLTRMENTHISNSERFDLSKEVQMSVSVFESIIYENKIQLQTEITEGIEFNGEREDIKHVVSILLDNAIKHTEENGKIIVKSVKEKSNIKIEVKNQGKEIPEEEREKIFERFYRVDKSRNRNEKRYGLGLSIAKNIVQKYKGSIYTTSKDGFTSFIVKL